MACIQDTENTHGDKSSNKFRCSVPAKRPPRKEKLILFVALPSVDSNTLSTNVIITPAN